MYIELAGAVAYTHVLGREHSFLKGLQASGLTFPADSFDDICSIVTAGCDRINILQPLNINKDLCLKGQVSYVGKSSMEVSMEVSAMENNLRQNMIEATFTMVARDRFNKQVTVPGIEPVTEAEKKLYEKIKVRRELRIARAKQNLSVQPPTPEERLVVHQLFLDRKTSKLKDWVDMGETKSQSLILMQPQKRNIHGKVKFLLIFITPKSLKQNH
eukprot:TRINITY_DN3951_c0_g1_i2.p1 TRINITY_DN3951_c0_g1~~TRINITY_DN3951_c0_g1_i2.p1  ORF type:complete len:215 (+),score=32.07 TRINITY_DN3951_c0_g1_i2:197-841(+)